MTPAVGGRTIALMATSLAPDVKNQEWTDSFVVNDYPLRTLIAGN